MLQNFGGIDWVFLAIVVALLGYFLAYRPWKKKRDAKKAVAEPEKVAPTLATQISPTVSQTLTDPKLSMVAPTLAAKTVIQDPILIAQQAQAAAVAAGSQAPTFVPSALSIVPDPWMPKPSYSSFDEMSTDFFAHPEFTQAVIVDGNQLRPGAGPGAQYHHEGERLVLGPRRVNPGDTATQPGEPPRPEPPKPEQPSVAQTLEQYALSHGFSALALTELREYADAHQGMTYEQILQSFPDYHPPTPQAPVIAGPAPEPNQVPTVETGQWSHANWNNLCEHPEDWKYVGNTPYNNDMKNAHQAGGRFYMVGGSVRASNLP